MDSDERAIRSLVESWHAATRAGDVDSVLQLMTDDVVFLVPGRAPMRREEFARLSRVPVGTLAPKIEGTSDVLEIQVSGELAYMWTKLSVVVTPPTGDSSFTRTGHTLTVLRCVDGRWLIARDANLLTAGAPQTPQSRTDA